MLQVVGDGLSSYQIADSCMPEESTSEIRNVASMDPNEMVGPAGGGPLHAITGAGTHRYAVCFENAASASAPAQEVAIRSQLDPSKYDLSTLRFSSLQFGSSIYTPPSDSVSVNHELDLASVDGLTVDMKAQTSPSGAVEWTLRSINPITGELPQDPMIGFLPPNKDGSEGQGVVFYDVALKNPARGQPLALQRLSSSI